MYPYWILFLITALLALFEKKSINNQNINKWTYSWKVTYLLLVLMIGLRHEVGGDWIQYEILNEEVLYGSFDTSLRIIDPSFNLINQISAFSGLGVYLLNTICALIFTYGLITFCNNQPRPWLALVVAVPYMITVGAMGYTRQGVAIGLIMIGMVSLQENKIWKYLIWVSLAATFHKSAVIMIPAVALAGSRRPILTITFAIITGFLLYQLLLQESFDSLMSGYIIAQYNSTGAGIRLAMNVFPALIFLSYRKKFKLQKTENNFWVTMSIIILLFIILFIISPSSTAIDRLGLYWMPMQLFVFSRLPEALSKPDNENTKLVKVIVLYSGLVYFVWLFFADNAGFWLPYQFYPWVWMSK